MNTFGKALRQARIGKGLTGPEAARIARVTQSQLSDWELGKHVPSRASLDKLRQVGLLTREECATALLGPDAA